MTARLYNAKGEIVREWKTDDVDAAMTATRNCPPGWRVEVENDA